MKRRTPDHRVADRDSSKTLFDSALKEMKERQEKKKQEAENQAKK